jgi:outer membrane protein TolC
MRLLWIAALVCAMGRSADARVYTLAQLTDKVRREYPGVLLARHGVEVALAKQKEAARAWAPIGALDTSIFGSTRSNCALAGGQAPPATWNKELRERYCFNATLSTAISTGNGILDALPVYGLYLGTSLYLSQPIYSFGKIESGIATANSQVEAARQAERVAVEEALLNATRAYWGVKTARVARDVLNDVSDKLREWIGQIRSEMEGANKGGYTEADLARLKTALDGVVLYRLEAERNLAFAEEGLRVLTDDEQANVDSEELALVDIVPRPLEWFEQAARVQRPEAKLLDIGLSGARANRRARRAELLPDLALVFRFNATYSSSQDSAYNAFMSRATQVNGVWSLNLHLPLDLLLRHERLVQARFDERALVERNRESLGKPAVDVARA